MLGGNEFQLPDMPGPCGQPDQENSQCLECVPGVRPYTPERISDTSWGRVEGGPRPNNGTIIPSQDGAENYGGGNSLRGRLRLNWTLQRKRALLAMARKCRPGARGFRDRLLAAWNEEFPELMTTKGALGQAHCKLVRQVEVARSEIQPSPLRKLVGRSYFDTPTKQKRRCESSCLGLPAAGVDTQVNVSAKRALRFDDSKRAERSDGPDPLIDRLKSKITAYYGAMRKESEGNFERRHESVGKMRFPHALIRAANKAALQVWESEGERQSVWGLNCLVYATGITLRKELVESERDRGDREKVSTEPDKSATRLLEYRRWYIRIQRELTRQKKGIKLTRRALRNRRLLIRKYGGTIVPKLELERSKLQAIVKIQVHKSKRTKVQSRYRLLNRQFRSKGVKTLQAGTDRMNPGSPAPDKKDLETFWTSIVGVGGECDSRHPDVLKWYETLGEKPSPKGDVKITKSEWNRALKKIKPWKAAGPDQIRPYWFKSLPGMAEVLRQMCEQFLNAQMQVPKWLIRGRTVLIPKEGCTGLPGQYRPIACLNAAYKLLTSALSEKLTGLLAENDILPIEQRAMRRGHRGCLDALLVDGAITESHTVRRDNLSVAWIDFQKAYDRVPHRWIIRALSAIGAPERIVRLVDSLAKNWETVFEARTGQGITRTKRIPYKRGVYQGDSLSPLLFCLCIIPISICLRKFRGITIDGSTKLTHLLYMDDLKVYARGEGELGKMVKAVEGVSKAVGMAFGLNKCATASMFGGKVKKRATPVTLDGAETVKALGIEHEYRYLGIRQIFDPKLEAVKGAVKKVVNARAKRVIRSELSGRNKSLATNAWVLAVIRYYLTPVRWSQRELKSLDRGFRRRLRGARGHFRGAAIERFSLPRAEGGRGFRTCQQMYVEERVSAGAYLVLSGDPLLQAVVNHQRNWNGQHHSLIQEARQILSKYTSLTLEKEVLERNQLTPRKVAKTVTQALEKLKIEQWQRKVIHGPFRRTIEAKGIDKARSLQWLRKGKLSTRTEALIMAAQDGVLQTRAYKQRVQKQKVDPNCRCCGDRAETVGHILSGCETKCWNLYKERHDRILAILIRYISDRFDIKQHTRGGTGNCIPDQGLVLEGRGVRLSVDANVPTERELRACRPDLVLYWNEVKVIVVFEVACAFESCLLEREKEKWLKYEPLAADLAAGRRDFSVVVVPVVIGSLGVVGSMYNRLNQLGLFKAPRLEELIMEVQVAALTSSARILRTHLATKNSARMPIA